MARVRVKQTKSINYICDKIFVTKNMRAIKSIYPFKSGPLGSSVYRCALVKVIKDAFFRVMSWLLVDCIFLIVSALLQYMLPSVSTALMVLCVIFNIVSLICNLLCFRYRFIEAITLSPNMIVSYINSKSENILSNYKSKRITGDNQRACVKDYKTLDKMSQIVDTESIRIAKLNVLMTLKNEFSDEWEYETDTVLVSGRDNIALEKAYLAKVSNFDKDLLGYVSRQQVSGR